TRSWPFLAATSAAIREGRSRLVMWSTVTSILFWLPQSVANLSNQVSYSGTKWFHCRIRSCFLPEVPPLLDVPGGAQAAAAPPTARVAAPCMKRRRLTRFSKSPLILVPPLSWMAGSSARGPPGRLGKNNPTPRREQTRFILDRPPGALVPKRLSGLLVS